MYTFLFYCAPECNLLGIRAYIKLCIILNQLSLCLYQMQWKIQVLCCHKHIFILHKLYLFYLNMSSARGVTCLLNKFEIAVTNFSLFFVIFDSSSLSMKQ